MLVYLIMLCGIALIYHLCYITTWVEKKKKRNFLIWSGIFIVLIMGSRWEGYQFADTGMYVQIFNKSKSYGVEAFLGDATRDTGYYLMVWYLARIFPSHQWFIYFECAFLIFSVFIFIYCTTDKPLFVVFLFLGTGIFTFYLSAFRQAFAFSFCLLSYLLLQKVSQGKEKGNFFRLLFGLLLFYIALTMHASAIVFVIPLSICLIKNYKLKIFLIFLLASLIVLFRSSLLSVGNDAMDKEYEIEANFSILGFIIQTIIFAFPMILLLLVPQKKSSGNAFLSQETYYYNLLAISIVGLVFYLLRLYTQGFERVAIYFTIAICPLYPTVFKRTLPEKMQNELTWVICILCGALLLWRVMDAGPFIFFWQK